MTALLALILAAAPAQAVTARLAFIEAYDNVDGGSWYRGYDNESATLAWGESYVMMGLAAMFRATGDPGWLDALAWHAEAVLAQRDDARGVTDYRGVSGACWRNSSYQDGDYCYVVHSGMLIHPMVEYTRLVAEHGLEDDVDPRDGERYGDKAATFLAAARETVALHDDQWNSAGYYIFRPDADFLTYAGVDLPLNQSNAMGRALVSLYQVTGDAEYLDKATALAARFEDQLTTSGDTYLWNYWGGSYSAHGEDVSHAAINVDFAALCAEAGIVFDSDDLERFAATLLDNVLVDDGTVSDWVGGGSTNGSSYRPQVARWLRLSPVHSPIYTGIRNLYDQDYPPESIGSGSTLVGWALLAEHELVHCPLTFYYVDWQDEDPHDDNSWREATAYGANILTLPPDWSAGCMIPTELDLPRDTQLQQWDGAAYHTVASFQATGGETTRFVPYDTRWPYEYWDGKQLYQLADSFVEGDGPRVREQGAFELPTITSAAPDRCEAGAHLSYQALGSGDDPLWWSLTEFPTGARVDHSTGELGWACDDPGLYTFSLRLENDVGSVEQAFEVRVAEPDDTAPPGDSDPPDDSDPADPQDTADSTPGHDSGDPKAPEPGGCGCTAPTGPVAALLTLLLTAIPLVRRRESP